MYTDLRENEELLANNRQILLLMDECVEEDDREVDFEFEIHNVVDVNWSQTKSNRMTKIGKSFV